MNGEGQEIVCQERRILGDHVSLDPDTLCIHFVAMPLDEQDEFTASKSANGRALKIPKSITNEPHILLELYLTKVVNRQLEIAKPISSLTLGPFSERDSSKVDYRDHANFNSSTPVSITYHITQSSSSDPAETTIDVETIETTPEWWICQLTNSYNALQLPMDRNIW